MNLKGQKIHSNEKLHRGLHPRVLLNLPMVSTILKTLEKVHMTSKLQLLGFLS